MILVWFLLNVGRKLRGVQDEGHSRFKSTLPTSFLLSSSDRTTTCESISWQTLVSRDKMDKRVEVVRSLGQGEENSPAAATNCPLLNLATKSIEHVMICLDNPFAYEVDKHSCSR